MNQIEPLVSVVIPCFNHEYYIEECLYSVLNQDYTNMEIIVTDDYSTDKSREILKKINEIYPEINIIYNSKNLGLTTSMNYMLSIAKGEYIAQFSGDDFWIDNSKISKQISWFSMNPGASICYTGTKKLFSNGIYEKTTCPMSLIISENNLLKKMYLLGENYSSFLLRKEFVPIHGVYDGVDIFSDWYYVCEIAHKGLVGGIEDITTVYRKHDKSLSNIHKNKLIFEQLELLVSMKRNLFYHNIVDDVYEMILFLIQKENDHQTFEMKNQINWLQDKRIILENELKYLNDNLIVKFLKTLKII